MSRTKNYLVAACALSVMAGVPTAAYGLTPTAAPSHGVAVSAPAGAKNTTTAHVRVVAPGEKVTVAPGVKLWLTAGGKMCWQLDGVSPDCWGAAGGKQGRIGTTGGGPSDSSHHATMYGSYTGRATPAGVRSTVGETNQGTVLTLAGHPGWGAWYTKVRATKMTPAYNRHKSHGAITVYGTSGQTIATFETGLIYGKPFPGKTSWPTATQR